MVNNESAFPRINSFWDEECEAVVIRSRGGMTLRDWFAGQALVGAVTQGYDKAEVVAYRIADAMLAERAKKQQ